MGLLSVQASALGLSGLVTAARAFVVGRACLCVCVYVCVCWHCLCCDLVTWSLVRFEGASVPYLQGVIKRLMPTEDRAGQVPSLHLCDLMGINICVLSVLLSSVCNYCTI